VIDRRSGSGIDDDATLGNSAGRGGDDGGDARRTPKLGDTIGRYVLLRPIASGGMGLVWAAWDPELDRNVALKLLLPRKGGKEEREALVGEARALARLSHPHVVQVYDVGTWGDEVWVALEYLGGTSLERWVKSRPRTWSEILELLLDAGRGLAAAHASGLVHLDVKPGNVVVADDGVVRVLDFGLSRRVQAESLPTDTGAQPPERRERGTRAAVGTIGYIAPELMLGAEPDARCDQFGFCVMAWEALVGVRPFAGRGRTDYERAVLQGGIGDPPAGTRVPRRVLRVLRRGLARRPDQRFVDMDALLLALSHARASWVKKLALPAAVGAAAIGALVLVRRGGPDGPSCDGGRAEFAAVWTPERRAAIERAFAATNEPYAASAWAMVAARIASWGDEWSGAMDGACATAVVRHETSEEVERRKTGCLRDQLLAVDALAGVFVVADRVVVENAGAAARALPDPNDCSDPDHLVRVDALRDDGDAARQLARARAQLDSYRLVSAIELANAIAARADAAHSPGIAAAAHLVAGRAESRRGAVDESIAALHRAIWSAEQASDDEVRADAYVELVYSAGHLGHDFARGRWYAREAAEIMTRIGATSDSRSVLEANLGAVLTDEGHYADAVARYRHAIDMRVAAGFGADDVFATLANNLGGVHLAQADYGAAAAWFTQAHALRVVLSGPDHPDVADVLVNLGNVLHVLGQHDAALAHLERATDVLVRTRGKDDPTLRVVHNDLAVVLAELGRRDDALSHYRESLRLWRRLDERHPMIGVVQHNIAEIHVASGRHHEALALEREALAVLQRAYPAGHPYVVAVLAGLGEAELARGQPRRALPPLRAAGDMLAHVEADLQLEGDVAFRLARALVGLDREPAIARAYERRARAIYTELGARTRTQLAALDAWAATR
jgi:tetratricopeptide (TPR) repeat protein